MKQKRRKIEVLLGDELKDPNFVAEYLSDAMRENDMEGLLLAVRDVISARGGMTKFSRELKSLHRVSLYKALTKGGNPLFSTMIEILDELGIGLKPYAKRSTKVSRQKRVA